MSTDGGACSRRRFLIGSLAGAGVAWLTSRWPLMRFVQAHAHQAPGAGQSAKLEFFSPEQAVEIEAVAAQIIPSDHTPGAREARVVRFIDRALATFDRNQQEIYTKGLIELQAETRARFPPAGRFSELTAAQQVELLEAIEESRFFKRMRVHTVEGFLANPVYGGNSGKVGWHWIGFDDSPAFQAPFGFYAPRGG